MAIAPIRSSRRRQARGLRVLGVGRKGSGIRLVDSAIDGFSQTLTHRARREGATACACRWSAHSRSRTRWSRPAWRSPRAAIPRKVFAALEGLKARRAGSNWSASATARRFSSTTPTSRMRSPRRWKRCGLMRSASWSSCSAPAATAIKGKRPMMGAIAAEKADARHRHRRQSAQRRSGRDPRGHPGAAPRRDRDRRPRRGDPHARSPTLQPGDVLVVAGKGHESGQIVGDRTLPFSDHEAVAAALREKVA